ncbi:hypothetical protein EON65_15365 [archaeon]|nr:MAG: hypothetical protein EON65_15365 [archaeon]
MRSKQPMDESMNPFSLVPADQPQQEESKQMEVNDGFDEPTEEESQWAEELIGHRISVFWDGDQVYYPALVTRYDETKEKFLILYEGDEIGREYVEDLRNAIWKIDRAAGKIEPPKIELEVMSKFPFYSVFI